MNIETYESKFDGLSKKIVEEGSKTEGSSEKISEIEAILEELSQAKADNLEHLDDARKKLKESRIRLFWVNRFLERIEKRINDIIDLYNRNKDNKHKGVKPSKLRRTIHVMDLFSDDFEYTTEDNETYILLTSELQLRMLYVFRSFLCKYKKEQQGLNDSIEALDSIIKKLQSNNADYDRKIADNKGKIKAIKKADKKAKNKVKKLQKNVNRLNNKFVNEKLA